MFPANSNNEGNWRDSLDENEAHDVQWAQLYAAEFNHRTPNASQLALIAKMAHMLDMLTAEALPDPDATARADYEAFAAQASAYRGRGLTRRRVMPAFDELDEGTKNAWRTAALAHRGA